MKPNESESNVAPHVDRWPYYSVDRPECCMCNSPPTEPFNGKWYCHDHLLEVQERERTGGWSTVWPTETGDYWFWGRPHREYSHELLLVEVNVIGSQTMCRVFGGDRHIYRDDIRDAHWMPATIPDPPKLAPTLESK